MLCKINQATAVLVCVLLFPGAAGAQTVFPHTTWTTASPEAVGMDSSRLAANLSSFPGPIAVVRRGYLVYTKGDIAHSKDLFSVSKSITALIFARLQLMGRVGYDDLIPGSALPTPPLASYRHFLTMTSDYGLTPHDPGRHYAYNNSAVQFYGAHMARTHFPGRSPVQILQDSVFNSTGRQDSVSFSGHWGGWDGGFRISTRDLARIGLMVLSGGSWNGAPVVSGGFVNQLFISQIAADATPNWSRGPADQWNEHVFTESLKGNYSFGWWILRNYYPPAVSARGRNGKTLIVSPQHDLVIAALPDVYNGPGDGQYLRAVVDAIRSSTNATPGVNAGGDRTITLPADTVFLDAAVSDDGQPNPPGRVTTAWSKISGPGTVTFGNAGAVDTTARFSAAGSYVLRLTASDSTLSASDDVMITVRSTSNSPPTMNAGSDHTLTLPTDTVALDGTVTDDGLPNPPGQVSITWSKVSGPGTVTFGSVNAVDTSATFSAAGSYVLRLTATDSALSTSDEVSVTVNSASVATIKVTSFTLINADTEQPIASFDPLASGATLSLAALPTRNLNIRANTSPATVGSVRFSLTGAAAHARVENAAPYALFGDNNGDFSPWTARVGTYTLTATPYPRTDGMGTAGAALTVTFTVTN